MGRSSNLRKESMKNRVATTDRILRGRSMQAFAPYGIACRFAMQAFHQDKLAC